MTTRERENKTSADDVYKRSYANALDQGYSPDRAKEVAQRAVRDYWMGNGDVELEEEDY
jgi:hypothetical protein